MTTLARVIAAREALEVGEYLLVAEILRDLEDDLRADEHRWVYVFDGPLVADMSVLDEERERGR